MFEASVKHGRDFCQEFFVSFFFLATYIYKAEAVAALPGIWILAWGGVLALLWDHYSNGQSLPYK